MIRSLNIQGYRCFDQFEMTDLGRLNLLVGANNSGKTSALEAIYLLVRHGNLRDLQWIMVRRGEVASEEPGEPEVTAEVDLRSLFHGYEAGVGSRFAVQASDGAAARSLECIISATEPGGSPVAGDADVPHEDYYLNLQWNSSSGRGLNSVVVRTNDDSLVHRFRLRRSTLCQPAGARVDRFVCTNSLSADDIASLWREIPLTPEEEFVTQAVQAIEPSIERFAVVKPSGIHAHGGLVVKVSGSSRPVPIGSMGDGIWRILALAMAGVNCRDRVLLVDEIDTGLHHTVMGEMWRIMHTIADRYNVQIFATTHNIECFHALATICREDVNSTNEVSVQRIELNRRRAVSYSERDIAVATEQHIEVR
ncbi:MAG: AAA family ATPase [Phycisphaerae bacterium]|nr:AAA family ATPase [Phycisphaerae bacterium]